MPTPFLPYQRDPIAGGLTTPNNWYEFFRSLRQFIVDSGLDAGIIDDILTRLTALEEDNVDFAIQGLASISVNGTPDSGNVTVQLVGDVDAPGNTYYYGTDATGVRGWFNLSFLNLSDTPDSYTGQSGRFIDVVSAETGLEFSSLYIDYPGTAYNAGTLVYPSFVAFEDTLLVGSKGNEQDAISINGVTAPVRIKASTFGGSASILIHQHSTTAHGELYLSRANSNSSTHSAVTNGMTVGSVTGLGWASSTSRYLPVGDLVFEVDSTGTVGTGSMPGRIKLRVTPNGAVTPVDVLTVTNNQVVEFEQTPNVNGTDVALITQSVTNGDTTHSPSGDAVFDAIPNASYRTIMQCASIITAGAAAGTYALNASGDGCILSGADTAIPLQSIYIDSADFPTVNGITTKLRIRVQLYTNDTAPTGNYTFGLYPIARPGTSGGSGVNAYTLGTVVAGSDGATFTTPAADGLLNAVGADFALPSNGHYVIGVVTTAAPAANSNIQITASLQLRNA